MQDYIFCPMCGARYPEQQKQNKHKTCIDCGFHIYSNLRVTGSGIIVRNEKMLFVIRKYDPQKGKLDVSGGFSEPNEHPRQTVKREIAEELNVQGQVKELLGVYAPIYYQYQSITYANCDLFYRFFPESFDFTPQDDVADIEWRSFDNLPQKNEIAFRSLQQFVEEVKDGKVLIGEM